MKKFINNYKHFRNIQALGDYRLCWIPMDNKGNGMYSVIEFFDEELDKIDSRKVELLILK